MQLKQYALLVFSLVYWAGTSLLHLQFSLFLVTPIVSPLGSITPKHYAVQGSVVMLGLLVAYLSMRLKQGRRRLSTLSYWLLWLGLVLLANKYLLATPVENIHFPQYAILSYLLAMTFAKSEPATAFPRILFWTTLLGMVDECYQYFHLTVGHSSYLDFNDFFLNELGAAAGLLVFYGFTEMSRPAFNAKLLLWGLETRISLVLLFLFLLLLFSARLSINATTEIPPGGLLFLDQQWIVYLERVPGILGSWQRDFLNGRFYVLAPAPGLGLLFLTGFVFSCFSLRVRGACRACGRSESKTRRLQ